MNEIPSTTLPRPRPLPPPPPMPSAQVLRRRDALLDTAIGIEARIAQLQAIQAQTLAGLAANPIPLPTRAEALRKQWTREEVGCALRISFGEAADRIATSQDLVRELPGMFALLKAGVVSWKHASVLSAALLGHDRHVKGLVEELVLELAPAQTPGEFRRAVLKAILTVAPKPAQERHRDALAQRRVVASHGEDGMGELWASLPSPELARLMATIHTLARGFNRENPDDPRTPDQRNADALLALANGPDGTPAPMTINVCVALSTLVGLDEQPADITGAGTAGINPITAVQARMLALDKNTVWRRLITDPLGKLVDYGRTVYRPPAPLADYVTARDRTDRFPHSTRPATSCELDHRLDWALGGHTNEGNLEPLSPRHHKGKHEAGWRLSRTPDGTHHWTSPLGKHYQVPPATYPTDTTATAPQPDEEPPPF